MIDLPNPPCQNHPDRESRAHYRSSPIRSLCFECMDANPHDTLSDLERAEIHVLDYLVLALGDGVKVVYDSEKAKMSSLRMKT